MFFSKSFRASFFALMLTLSMILYSFYGIILQNFLGENSLLFLIVTQFFVYGLPIIIYFKFTAENPIQTLKLKPIGFINIILIVCISIFIQPVLMFISAISSAIFGSSTEDFIKSFETLPIYFTILSTAVFPAILEEITFRGIIFSNLRGKSILKASIFTGLLFGMAHLNGEQFFYAAIMGAVFCYFVYKTGSIWASIISHFTINFSQTALTLYYIKTGVFDMAEQVDVDFFQALISSAILAIYMLFPLMLFWILFLFHNRKKETDGIIIQTEEAVDYYNDNDEKLLTIPFFINVIIFLLFIW